MIDKLQVQHHIDQIELHQNALKEMLLNAYMLDEERDDYESEIKSLSDDLEKAQEDIEEYESKIQNATQDLENFLDRIDDSVFHPEAVTATTEIRSIIKNLEE